VATAAFRSAAKGRDTFCCLHRARPRRRREFLFWQWLVWRTSGGTTEAAGPARATHGACMFARLLAALALHVPTPPGVRGPGFRGRRPHRITTKRGKGSPSSRRKPRVGPRARFRGCKNSGLRACIAQVFRLELHRSTRTGESTLRTAECT
jgi:hypothetical protein